MKFTNHMTFLGIPQTWFFPYIFEINQPALGSLGLPLDISPHHQETPVDHVAVPAANRLVAGHLSIRLDPVLQAEELPAPDPVGRFRDVAWEVHGFFWWKNAELVGFWDGSWIWVDFRGIEVVLVEMSGI